MVVQQPTPPPPVQLVERIERKVLRPLMSNFRNMAEAIFELVDNPIDEFDGVHGGSRLQVTIDIRRDKGLIVVEDVGGRGMGPDELQEWLDWGRTPTGDGISEYGQGGKAAMGYLGNAWVIKAKRYDQPWAWEVGDDNWSDGTVAAKNLTARPFRAGKELAGLGYCRIEIRQLRRHRRLGAEQIGRLRSQLGNTYRRLLEDGTLTVTLNGELVPPLELPLYEARRTRPMRFKGDAGWSARGWVGRLKRDARARTPIPIRGGIRLTRQGRLICDGEYFGHPGPAYKASLNTLIGELDLPRQVPVLPNKTDFDRDSGEWGDVQKRMHEILKPDIDDLLKQPDEDKVTKEERQRVRAVRELMMQALKLLVEQGQPNPFSTDGQGRKPPEPRPGRPETEERQRGPYERQKAPESASPAPEDAVGRLRRLGRMPDWLPDVLDPEIRSVWRANGSQRLLVINKKFPLCELRKMDDLYIAETAALELVKPVEGEDRSVSEYADEVNRLVRAFCAVWAEVSP
jgi:hypothetical protein